MGHRASLLQSLTKKEHSELKRKHYWGSWGLLNTHVTQCGNSCSKATTHSAATVFDSPSTWILWKRKWSLLSPVPPGDPQLFYQLWAMGSYMEVLETTLTNSQCLYFLLQAQQYYKQHLRGEKPPSHHAFVWEKRCQGLVITRQSLMCLHWSLQHTAHSSINRSKQRVLLYICVAPTVC